MLAFGDVGGFVGENGGSIVNSYATVDATIGDSGNVGGLAGGNGGLIVNSYATGDATGKDAGALVGINGSLRLAAGGEVNYVPGTISACYATGNAETRTSFGSAGSLVATNIKGTISACYATGNSTATESFSDAAGLVGHNNDIISTCYATGNSTATGTRSNVGGLVGWHTSASATMHACYATGNATTASGSAGGLAGTITVGQNAVTSITDSYFDYETSGRQASEQFARSTSDLQTPTDYGSAATDIYANWNIDTDNGLSIGVDNGQMPGDPGVDDPWDFGVSSEYPALKVDFDRSSTATVAEFGEQRQLSTPTLEITNIAPMSGPVGETVTISGTGFSTTSGQNVVTFLGAEPDPSLSDNVLATNVTANGTTELEVVVPVGVVSGPISVSVSGGTPEESTVFTILEITNIVPVIAEVGATIKVVGTGFSTIHTNDSLSFRGSDYVVANDFLPDVRDAATRGTDPLTDTLVVNVPRDAETGTIWVKILSGTPKESVQEFELLPTIEKIEPGSAEVGDPIKIIGTGFSTIHTNNSVLFEGSDYIVASAFMSGGSSFDTLIVNVPSDAERGKIMVKVLDGIPVESAREFIVLVPGVLAITSISPEYGEVGDPVKILGTAFSSTIMDDSLSFDGGTTYVVAEDFIEDTRTGVSLTIDTLLVNVPLDLRAQTRTIWVKVDNGTPKESAQEFEILPIIGEIFPRIARVGATIKISGTGFSTNYTENSLSFGGSDYVVAKDFLTDDRDASIRGIDPVTDTLVVDVPSDAQTGVISLRVLSGTSVSSSQLFTVPVLAITKIEPGSAEVGDPIKIIGTGFSTIHTNNSVLFEGSDYIVASAFMLGDSSPDTLIVNVPSDAERGKIMVKVLDGIPVESAREFIVLMPDVLAITSISPEYGEVGDPVKISGTAFSSTIMDDSLSFDGGNTYVVAEDFIEDTRTGVPLPIDTLVVDVPIGAERGKIWAKVLNGTPVESAREFIVLMPDVLAITSISPEYGEVGDPVKILGTAFSSTVMDDSVSFDGGTTYVVAEDFIEDKRTAVSVPIDTLLVNVPLGAQTGMLMVRVLNSMPTISSQMFVVTTSFAPMLTISNISPESGAVGDMVTITGTGFSSTTTDNTVTFIGTASNGDEKQADVSTAGTTTLVVTVPTEAVTGLIQVKVNGQTFTSSQIFEVVKDDPADPTFSVPEVEGVVRVYPNPTSGEIRFTSLSSTGTYAYKVYSLLGKEILSSVLRGVAIDVSSLADGQYILVLRSNNGSELLRTRLLIVR